MKSVMTTLYFSWIQLKRNFRDPLTLGVLFAIPVLLLLLFGSFATGDSISLKVAVINHSDEEFANEFTKNLEQVEVFNQSEESLSTDDAVEKMNAGDLLIFNSLEPHGIRPNTTKDKVRLAQYISMMPAEEENEGLREWRISSWRERKAPEGYAFPGDPRRWEQTKYPMAELSALGKKLLGLERW